MIPPGSFVDWRALSIGSKSADRRPKSTPLIVALTVAFAPAKLVGVAQPGRARCGEEAYAGDSGAVLEAPILVAGLDDVAVMREAVEQRGSHFWVAKDAGPFTEGEIFCDDDRRAFVETADQVEQVGCVTVS